MKTTWLKKAMAFAAAVALAAAALPASAHPVSADSAQDTDRVPGAVANGITTGYGEGTFQPLVNCSRAMIVTFLQRLSALAG